MQDTAVVFTHFEFLANREMDMDEIDDLEATQAHHAAPKQSMLKLFYNGAILMKTSRDSMIIFKEVNCSAAT